MTYDFGRRYSPPRPPPDLTRPENLDPDALATRRQAERNAAETTTSLLHKPDVLELVRLVSENMLKSFRATHQGSFMDHLAALPTANLHTLHKHHHQWEVLLRYRVYQVVAARALQELWDEIVKKEAQNPSAADVSPVT